MRNTADDTQARLAVALASGDPIAAPFRRRVRLLIGGSVFVAAGIGMIVSGRTIVGWACVCFFGLVLVAGCLETFRPGHIIVTSTGFEIFTSFGQRATYEFGRCGPFETYCQVLTTVRRTEIWWVVFDDEGKQASTWLQRANASMVHHNSQFKPDVFGLSAQPLAETFNRLRREQSARIEEAQPRPDR